MVPYLLFVLGNLPQFDATQKSISMSPLHLPFHPKRLYLQLFHLHHRSSSNLRVYQMTSDNLIKMAI